MSPASRVSGGLPPWLGSTCFSRSPPQRIAAHRVWARVKQLGLTLEGHTHQGRRCRTEILCSWRCFRTVALAADLVPAGRRDLSFASDLTPVWRRAASGSSPYDLLSQFDVSLEVRIPRIRVVPVWLNTLATTASTASRNMSFSVRSSMRPMLCALAWRVASNICRVRPETETPPKRGSCGDFAVSPRACCALGPIDEACLQQCLADFL
jgi:hypothetical protein